MWLAIGAAAASAVFLTTNQKGDSHGKSSATNSIAAAPAPVEPSVSAAKPTTAAATPTKHATDLRVTEPPPSPPVEANIEPRTRGQAGRHGFERQSFERQSFERQSSTDARADCARTGRANASRVFSPARWRPRCNGCRRVLLFAKAGGGSVSSWGLSIRYRADGRIQKLYYANDTKLDPVEVSCMRQKLIDFSAGPGDKAQVVGYRLHVSSEKREAKIAAKR